MAMDFSGQQSRVIENPSEALSVAVEEGLSWRVRSKLKTLPGRKDLHVRGNDALFYNNHTSAVSFSIIIIF